MKEHNTVKSMCVLGAKNDPMKENKMIVIIYSINLITTHTHANQSITTEKDIHQKLNYIYGISRT